MTYKAPPVDRSGTVIATSFGLGKTLFGWFIVFCVVLGVLATWKYLLIGLLILAPTLALLGYLVHRHDQAAHARQAVKMAELHLAKYGKPAKPW